MSWVSIEALFYIVMTPSALEVVYFITIDQSFYCVFHVLVLSGLIMLCLRSTM